MAQECKKVIVKRCGTSEDVLVAVAPAESVRDILAAIGAPGALGLSTGGRPGLLIFADSTVWNWVEDGQTLYVVRSSHPC